MNFSQPYEGQVFAKPLSFGDNVGGMSQIGRRLVWSKILVDVENLCKYDFNKT